MINTSDFLGSLGDNKLKALEILSELIPKVPKLLELVTNFVKIESEKAGVQKDERLVMGLTENRGELIATFMILRQDYNNGGVYVKKEVKSFNIKEEINKIIEQFPI